VGPRDDWNEWSKLVNDEEFAWPNAKRCLDKVTNLHPEIPKDELRKYVDAKVEGMCRHRSFNAQAH